MTQQRPRPILVFGYGNPSRGDDALGPELIERLREVMKGTPLVERIDLLTDFQLQIEHILDLAGREQVIFVDAALSLAEPFEFKLLAPDESISYTTHAMHPASIIKLYADHFSKAAPPCHMFSIRGHQFELGQPLSREGEVNLNDALGFLLKLIEGEW
ncbi:MAG: hydrogenase maturation protease [Pseudomonadota bacterium]